MLVDVTCWWLANDGLIKVHVITLYQAIVVETLTGFITSFLLSMRHSCHIYLIRK